MRAWCQTPRALGPGTMTLMEPWEVAAREGIRDLVARYNAGGDSGRIDDVVALFAADAVMDIDGREYAGHDAIRGMFDGVIAQVLAATEPAARPVVQHHTATLQIDVVDEQTAKSRCYLQVLMAHGLDHWGRYLDDYRVVDGRWLFARRRVRVDGVTPGGWAASLASRP
jgi:hypothetical protein